MLPEKIKLVLQQDPSLDWNEEHDRIQSTGNSFDERNQYDWWKQNHMIRSTFNEIKNEIKMLKKDGVPLKKRMISWTAIAKKAGCSRSTLFHPNRKEWVENYYAQLSSLLEEDNSKNVVKMVDLKVLTKELKLKLNASRDECAKWVKKFQDSEKRCSILEKRMYDIEVVISHRNKQIKELQNELKMAMDNNESNIVAYPGQPIGE